jgi:DNA modification methylase
MSVQLNTIYNEDCLETMRRMPDGFVNLVLTDPPYGIKLDKGFEGFGGFGGFGKPIARRQYVDNSWDEKIPSKEVFEEILRVSKRAVICGGNFFAHLLPQSRHWLFWDKLNTMPSFGDGELIWTNVDRKSVKKYTLEWNGLLGKEENRYHPTQKPLKLMTHLLATYSQVGDLVYDPFMGSGTTARACKDLGRNYIGSEISAEYCRIAESRLRQEVLL